jgi:hypothetical protein
VGVAIDQLGECLDLVRLGTELDDDHIGHRVLPGRVLARRSWYIARAATTTGPG